MTDEVFFFADVKQKKTSTDYDHKHYKKHIKCEPGNFRLCRGKRGDNVRVADNIEFVTQPKDIEIKEGDAAQLECSFRTTTGGNNLTVEWRKDSVSFRHLDLSRPSMDKLFGRDQPRVSIARDSGNLIFNYTQANDAGVYDCLVMNNDGRSEISSRPAKLDVIPMLKFLSVLKRKILVLNMTNKVHCKAQGAPTPTIVWTRDGASEQLPAGVSVENGTLIFEKVNFDHQGNYTCTASNAQGTINSTVVMTVAVTPQ